MLRARMRNRFLLTLAAAATRLAGAGRVTPFDLATGSNVGTGDYPGTGGRNFLDDGHFATVTLTGEPL